MDAKARELTLARGGASRALRILDRRAKEAREYRVDPLTVEPTQIVYYDAQIAAYEHAAQVVRRELARLLETE